MSTELKSELIEEHILMVTLNRPPVNALSHEVYKRLSVIFSETVKDEAVRVVVFCAEGRVFCGGQDVNEIVNDSPEETVRRRSAFRQALVDVYQCPVPVIAAVNGGAVGAGCILAASVDIVVASENAFFSIPEIDVGVIGGGKHLSRILPLSKVRRMALTGDRIPAAEFYRLGVIESLVKPERLMDEAMDYARKIASKSPVLLRRWKQSFIETEELNLLDGFALEQRLTQELYEHPDFRKASEGFFKKSKPTF